jgi:SAM-dependent methyltransferase
MSQQPTERFSSRVSNYMKYRPTYPQAVVDCLRPHGLTPESVVADVGSGTGLLTELFLRNGNKTFGVEPNKPMREAGEQVLKAFPNFISINGTAEATTLPATSVDIITAGQAFHWFDVAAARREFARILRPGGMVAIVWNDRHTDTTPFLRAYEQLLRTFATDYAQVDHKHITTDDLRAFFAPNTHHEYDFDNQQILDFDGLKGRLLSSSYAPEASHPSHVPMLLDLQTIFDAHNDMGKVVFAYQTQVHVGKL